MSSSSHEFDDEAEIDLVADQYAAESASMTPEERTARSDDLKQQGNTYFKEKQYHKAAYFYSCALIFTPSNEVLFSNRAQCRLKLEEYGSALHDADAAIQCNPNFVKGHYRKGCALMAMTRYKEAAQAFAKIKTDAEARKHYDTCSKLYKEALFAAAIASDMTSMPVEKISLGNLVLPVSYDGPAFAPSTIYDPSRPHEKYTPELLDWILEAFQDLKTNRVPRSLVHAILFDVYNTLRVLPSLVDVPIPAETKITVCGDTHGQYYDVLNIFKLFGKPSASNPYLFNGDFVDRGSFSYELAVMLLLAKLVYPEHVHLSRGNHESTNMNNVYGFKGEVLAKADQFTFDVFTDVFNALPLAHCLNQRVLVLHGGLFEDNSVTLDDIRKTQRFRQPPEKGVMCDALWSDPGARAGRNPPHRGCGVVFGPDVTKAFLDRNNLSLLVRSHEMKQEGYSVDHDGKCITVFSAPNYCDQMGNKGAVLIFNSACEYEVKQFSAVPHPNVPAMKFANQMMRFG